MTKPKLAHTQNTKVGTGDYYGVGKKNKLARIRSWSMGNYELPPKGLKQKPKALA